MNCQGDDSDLDSTYGGSIAGTDTTSIASSLYAFKYDNGRRYQSYREGQYILPVSILTGSARDRRLTTFY